MSQAILKGRIYNFMKQETKEKIMKVNEEEKNKFMDAFHSIIWMTYRKGITSITRPSIPKAHQHISDSGWGCMLRSGQMLFMNTLIRHMFGPNFSLSLLERNIENTKKYLSILMEFMDNMNGSNAAFSIGNIVEEGFKYKMVPKDWYGPSIIMSILSKLNDAYKPFKDIETIIFTEGVIYQNRILSKISPKGEWKAPLLVFIPFRLGLEAIPKENLPAIIRILDFPQCTGMIGGQGNAALYFIGHQNLDLIFLDPHVTQQAVEKPEKIWAEHLSYHYSSPFKLSVEKLDTCICYGKGNNNNRILFK